MDWTHKYADRLISAEEGADRIDSGESLYVGMLTNCPFEFAERLVNRLDEVRGLTIYHNISLFPWWVHAESASLRHITMFSSPLDRYAIRDGNADYYPLGSFATEHLVKDHPKISTAVVSLSPPDEQGEMSFGPCLWLNREISVQAKRIFAEIDPGYIRTAGDNRIHVSQIDAMWLREPAERTFSTPEPHELTAQAADKACQLVADELINDGDCLQIGTGDVTQRLPYYLYGKKNLGIQTELIPGGILPLMEAGVINGSRKQIAVGKTIGCAIVAPAEEIEATNNHPDIELWDFTRTDDIRMLTRNHNFKAINNALEVDVTGQVNAESIGAMIYSGPGGQPVFAISASYSPGGASIIVLPSCSLVDGILTSRIVASFVEGTSITVPRYFIDYVVTEYGIARLSGKTMGERIAAMLAITHPDLRDQVARKAATLYPI